MMDLHCHIDLYENPHDVINICKKNRLYVLSVTTTPTAWRGTSALTADVPRFNTALGLHPQLAKEREHELIIFDSYISETRYIGEIGLDGSKECMTFFGSQLRVFRHILSKCEEYPDKILTIHSRGAVTQVLEEIECFRGAGKPILHWFLGNKKQLIKAVELGCWFSVGPAMLNSRHGLKVLSWIPREKILLESDGPFVKMENRIILPSDTGIMVEFFSNTWNVSKSEVVRLLKNNLVRLLA